MATASIKEKQESSFTLDEYEQMSISCFNMYFRSDPSSSKVVPLLLLSQKAISKKSSKKNQMILQASRGKHSGLSPLLLNSC